MSKWNGTGIPPTRRKLHRLRETRRREQAAADKLQRQVDSQLERQARKLKVDQMLVDPDASRAIRNGSLPRVEPSPHAAVPDDRSGDDQRHER